MSMIKFCLDCDHEIDLRRQLKVGQRITCPNCRVELEIIKLEPLELDWVYNGPVAKPKMFDDWWSAAHKQS